MSSHSFLHGALVLALAGAASRVLGVFYVVVLPRVLNGEGYGLYTAVKPIQNTLLILAVAGVPVAIAKLVAERLALGDVRAVRQVLWLSITAMAVTGGAGAIALWWGAQALARSVLLLPDAVWVLRALAPSVPLIALTSVLRGYFQGLQFMTPMAVSQVAEQITRVVGTVVLAVWLAPYGDVPGVAGAMLGSVLGACCALMVLCGYFLIWRRQRQALLHRRAVVRPRQSWRRLAQRLVTLALPLVLGQILWPVLDFLDTVLVPMRLIAAGAGRSAAMTELGYLGMASQLMWFPTIFTLAVSASLVPAVAEAWALHQVRTVRRTAGEAMRVASLFGLPAALGLHLLAEPAAWLLFGHTEAGEPLAVLAFGTLAIGLQQVTAGTLQGLGKVGLPVRNLLLGAVVKLACNWFLIGLPWLGIKGAALGTVAGLATAAFLNYLAIYRLTGLTTAWDEWLAKPLAGAAVMALFVRLAYDGCLIGMETMLAYHGSLLSPFVVNAAATAAAIAAGVIVYGAAMLRVGGIRRRDIEAVPYAGPRCAAWLARRVGWR